MVFADSWIHMLAQKDITFTNETLKQPSESKQNFIHVNIFSYTVVKCAMQTQFQMTNNRIVIFLSSV